MNLNENLKLKGELTITHRGEDGSIKNVIHIPNLVVTAGKNHIASRMVGTSSTVMSHMALGTDSTAAAIGNTTLGGEVGRVTLASSSAVNNTITYTADFPAGTATGVLREAGILNNSSGGTLLCRTVFATVTKGAGDSISVNWVVTVS
jgi:hypothetical protein